MYLGLRPGTLEDMTVALLDRPFGGAVLREVTRRERLSAWLHDAPLDRALAAGERPEAAGALTLHRRRLLAPGTRRGIAKTLRGMVATTLRAPTPPARPLGPHVRHAAADLLALADRLEAT